MRALVLTLAMALLSGCAMTPEQGRALREQGRLQYERGMRRAYDAGRPAPEMRCTASGAYTTCRMPSGATMRCTTSGNQTTCR